MASTNEIIFAKALLSIHEGVAFEPSLIESLRSLCRPSADVITAPTKIPEPSNTIATMSVKPKPARKITKVAVVSKPTDSAQSEAERVTEPTPELKSAVEAIPVYVNDAYKTHKHRLQTLDPTKCMGRKCVNTHLVVGTRTEDKDIGANGRIYIEFQCGNLPAGPIGTQQNPGPLAPNGGPLAPKEGSSRLCQTHQNREAKYKTDTTKVWPEWFGRLDDADLYHNSRIIGSGYFFEKYPKGLANDPTTAPPINELILESPAETTVAPKRGRKPKVAAAVLKDSKSVEAPPLGGKGPPLGVKGPPLGAKGPKESVALDIVPKEVEWISFKHEGRMHIRNVQTGSVYWVDSTKKSTPAEMAIKERYVGKWIDGALDTLVDTDDDEA